MKRIITCSDGTWNKHGMTDKGIVVQTNVEKMFRCICKAGVDKITKQPVEQLKIYDEGVGSGYSVKDQIGGGITGAGIDKNIQDVYSFIVLNYQPGDEIYLFGFSRGAYTARSLGGLIRNCGILKPAHFHLINKAYELYKDRNDYSLPDSDLMKSFRSNYAYEDVTKIKFIGVWDTVGSLGIPLPSFRKHNMSKYKFHDVTLSCTVDYAYHALAIDERRPLFIPTLWQKSNTVKNDPAHPQVMEQRWFAGAHSNVGGGYADCGLSNIALQWMIDKAAGVGLCFNEPPLYEVGDCDKGEIINSYTLMYHLLGSKVWRTINLNDPDTNQSIDESVWEKRKKNEKYKSANLEELVK